jgi:signal transduction histidine kinase
MRFGVRTQFLGPLGLLAVALVTVSVYAAYSAAWYAQQAVFEQLDTIAKTLSQGGFPLTEPVLQQLKRLSGAEYLLHDEQRVRLTTLPTPQPGERLPRSLSSGALVRLGEQRYYQRTVVLNPPHPEAGTTVLILYPEERLNQAQRQAGRPALVFGLLGTLSAFVVAVVLAERLVRRVNVLRQHTQLIAQGNFQPMPLPQPRDQLYDLACSVNHMAEQLAQLRRTIERTEQVRLLGQLSGGLAHQLRNGVTGARLAVQLHARDCTSGDAEALRVSLRQLALVETNLQRFLALGRSESAQRETCSLTEIVLEAVDLLTPQCQHARIQLQTRLPQEPILLAGNLTQLRHLVLNLLTNAMEACGPGGQVTVEVWVDDWIHLQVSDTGPGPPAELAQTLFEPFVTGKAGGVGLGLAVARQAVNDHAGQIDWSRQADRTVFHVRLPR